MTETCRCPACGRDVPFAEGCADDAPLICDACWAEGRDERDRLANERVPAEAWLARVVERGRARA